MIVVINMLDIIICDSEKETVKAYSNTLKEVIETDLLDADVMVATTNPEDVLAYVKDKDNLFYVLLELLYDKGLKGVELAKKIRINDRESYIVFSTKHLDQVHTAFEGLIRPAGLLTKPVKKTEFVSLFLNAYCDHVNQMKKEECYSVTIGARLYRIPQRNICYFEAAQKKIFLNTDTQRIGYYDSLEAIGKRVDPHVFVRCHKGFIINTGKIEKVDYSEMTAYMTNGARIPISRTYKDHLKDIM